MLNYPLFVLVRLTISRLASHIYEFTFLWLQAKLVLLANIQEFVENSTDPMAYWYPRLHHRCWPPFVLNVLKTLRFVLKKPVLYDKPLFLYYKAAFIVVIKLLFLY